MLKKRKAKKKNSRKESRPGMGVAKQQKLRGRGEKRGVRRRCSGNKQPAWKAEVNTPPPHSPRTAEPGAQEP